MIKTFGSKETGALFNGRCAPRFRSFARVAERKLQMINDACTIDDLRAPPGNRLEALRGDRQGQWSIRVNDQWRICFRFEAGNAFEVEIVDYH